MRSSNWLKKMGERRLGYPFSNKRRLSTLDCDTQENRAHCRRLFASLLGPWTSQTAMSGVTPVVL